jgi:hypothetical protein
MLLPAGIKATVDTKNGGYGVIERVCVDGGCRCGVPSDLTDFISFTRYDKYGRLEDTDITLL